MGFGIRSLACSKLLLHGFITFLITFSCKKNFQNLLENPLLVKSPKYGRRGGGILNYCSYCYWELVFMHLYTNQFAIWTVPIQDEIALYSHRPGSTPSSLFSFLLYIPNFIYFSVYLVTFCFLF